MQQTDRTPTPFKVVCTPVHLVLVLGLQRDAPGAREIATARSELTHCMQQAQMIWSVDARRILRFIGSMAINSSFPASVRCSVRRSQPERKRGPTMHAPFRMRWLRQKHKSIGTMAPPIAKTNNIQFSKPLSSDAFSSELLPVVDAGAAA